MRQNPTPCEGILEAARACVPELLSVYLHGSACLGGFAEGRSDVDLLLFCGRAMTREERSAFGDALLRLHKKPAPIELSVLRAEDAGAKPPLCQFHFSELWAARYAAHDPSNPLLEGSFPDPDIPAYYRVIRERGITLFGPPPDELVPEVTDGEFWASVTEGIGDFSFADYGMFDSNILTLARILSFARTRRILTKAEGAEWGMEAYPRFAPLLSAALAAYRDGIPARYDPRELEEYRECMLREILAERVERRGRPGDSGR